MIHLKRVKQYHIYLLNSYSSRFLIFYLIIDFSRVVTMDSTSHVTFGEYYEQLANLHIHVDLVFVKEK